MATDQTDGVPPSRGSTILVNIGCTANSSAAERKMAAAKTRNRRAGLVGMILMRFRWIRHAGRAAVAALSGLSADLQANANGRPKAAAHISLMERVLLQSDRSEVLEPVLRLHEALHLGRKGVRIGVMHDPHQHGIVDDQ